MPILSNKHQFIYYPIPKVACSSIKVAIASSENIKLVKDHPHLTKFPEISLKDSYGHDYFKFAFVRNPWDRLVSCYKDKIVHCGATLPFFMAKYKEFTLKMPFGAFVKAVASIPDSRAEDHFISQHTYLFLNGKLVVDFLGCFEQLTEDWNTVCEHIGYQGFPLSHRKRVDGNPYRTYYTNNLKKIVAKRFEKDIDLFKYSF